MYPPRICKEKESGSPPTASQATNFHTLFLPQAAPATSLKSDYNPVAYIKNTSKTCWQWSYLLHDLGKEKLQVSNTLTYIYRKCTLCLTIVSKSYIFLIMKTPAKKQN